MSRGDNSVYARFKDESDAPATAPVSNDGKVEFVEKGRCSHSYDVERQDVSTKVLASAIRKVYVCLVVVCIIVIVLLVFTATNFVLIMQSRDRIVLHPPTQGKTETEAQYHIQVRDDVEIGPLDQLARDFQENDHPCAVYMGEVCYWLSNTKGKNFEQSRETCKNSGGEAGVVYNANYETLQQYIRQYSEAEVTSVWLGMTRNPETGEIQLLNHDDSYKDSISWAPSFPSTNHEDTSLCLRADKNVNSTNSGVLNINPYSRETTQFILCEMPWDDGEGSDVDYTTDVPTNSTDYWVGQ